MKKIRKNVQLLAGAAIIAALVLTGIVAPLLIGDHADAFAGTIHAQPSAEHLLGTDALGRDVLLRTLSATGLTLVMAAFATLLATVIGVLIGAGTALGRATRGAGARLIDLLVSYPPIIIALAVSVILAPGTTTVVLAIGFALAPQFARLSNSLTVTVEAQEFVTIARFLGLPQLGLLQRHIVPNIRGPLLVLISVSFANSIVALSGLSFLGLGAQAPAYDWGSLLASGLRDLYTNPAEALGPGLAILVTGLGAGLLGDSMANLIRPRSSSGRPTAPPVNTTAPPIPHETALEGGEAVVLEDLRVSVATGDAGRELVKGVSLDLKRGEVVGLVGESGSGKSLTAMAIARLLPATFSITASTIRVSEIDLTDQDKPAPARLALELGVVFQDPSSCFNPAVKIGAQLTETLEVHRGVGRRQARQLAVQALRDMRVTLPEQRMNQYPHELSGGMRQRAMIAMALLTQPKVLIADEPTTALDVTVQADVLRLMRAACREQGTAILLISHDITVVSAMCDRINVMYNGQIVERLTPQQIRSRNVGHPYTAKLLASSATLKDGPSSMPKEGTVVHDSTMEKIQ